VLRDNFTWLGSTTGWQSAVVDVRKYFRMSGTGRNVLALWSYNWLILDGKPPFLDLPSTGWDNFNNTGRGFIQGRYRGNIMLYLESEYRFGITRDGLFGAVLFANAETFSGAPTDRLQAVQPGAGTIKVRGVTPNPDRALWPSQFVKVRLVLDVLKDAKLVPSSAVQIGQNGPYVFIVKSDSTLELRPVKPGQPQGDLTVITEGVQKGEMVVTSGQLQLSPGMKVNPHEPDSNSGGEKPAQTGTIH
jgi:hypothetical protein